MISLRKCSGAHFLITVKLQNGKELFYSVYCALAAHENWFNVY